MWCFASFPMLLALLASVFVGGEVGSAESHSEMQQLDPDNFLIWGPGLQTDFVVPVRYFMVQAVDVNGKKQVFETTTRVRVWIQILDRHDGSYIVRFKLFQTYNDLEIEVLYDGTTHVAQSPYSLRGRVYHEKCHCPEPSLDDWMKRMNCPAGYRQIKQDLSIFGDIDMKAVKQEAVERFNQRGRHALCHYVVKNNQIYRQTYGEHVGFKMFMDAMLLSLTRKVHLPDVEFFVNLGDWPLEKRKVSEGPLPIFSWCGSDDTRDIVMPTYDVTESTLETMGRITLDLLSVQANTGPKWSNKSSVAFWRGRDSRQERLDLVKLSRKHPEVIDAKLTNMFFFKHNVDEVGELVKHISFFDFFKYKYQLNIDGTVAAYRFPYLLAGDSLVLKQDSIYYEHFYKDLKPYVHYVPLKKDLSDVMQQLQWAQKNDRQAEQIAKNGQDFVREHLMSRDIFCYHAVLFNAYHKKLSSPVEVDPDMELVPPETGREAECLCDRVNPPQKDEL
ncbi:hypothetical protein CAPTEDRAFT_221044 [Capitella teleta]|uniref:Glycosyl transferase CAP10 domain-containing protein n=1 Tax=Capitella teleta TaxID=283909 RepID=R7TPH8_CAPTE|nr:hypothetical protein CAPTEDRAFT_221044 [Capitella teleta]|eukprot:ELT95788.1 hypothetical protein CAPTEDRAFT_221044 [Capitella teleta]